jgi:RNA polymerase sigma-70 factor (ECF subfamily)
MTTAWASASIAYDSARWSDKELLDGMLRREHASWKEFHRRFDRLVHRCIHRVTSRFPAMVSSEDVREIHAQFLFGLTRHDMRKLRMFDEQRGNKLSSWIGMLATNAAWDHLRTLTRQPQCIGLGELEQLALSECDPYEQLLEKERWGRIDQTLCSFSEKDKTFVRLFYMDGLTPEQVAVEMSISVKTVYSKKHKIRGRLQRILEPMLEKAA